MKQLLITDLDDTLYDWIGFFVPAFNSMANEVSRITGIEKNQLLAEYRAKHQLYGSVEYPYATLELPSIIKKYNKAPASVIKEELDSAFHQFNLVRKEKLKLFDGVKETLYTLYKNGVIIIGYTESPEENGFYRLKRLGIAGLFKHVYVSTSQYNRDLSKLNGQVIKVSSKKPDKEVLLGICNNENCLPQNAAYVGDSLTKDILMASLAGVTSVLVNYSKEPNNYYDDLVAISSWTDEDFLRESSLKKQIVEKGIKPDYTISTFTELIEIVMNN